VSAAAQDKEPIVNGGALDDAPRRKHSAGVARFSYASFSSEALDCVKATSALAYAEGVPAEPRHLRRALHSSPSPDEWERARAARPGLGSVLLGVHAGIANDPRAGA
jgi:hypothetical protein